MKFVLMFGGEARTGLVVTPDGVEVFATPEDTADRISATGTALSRMAEAKTVLGEHGIAEGVGAVSDVGATVLDDVRSVTPDIGDDTAVVFVGRDASVLVTPDGDADTLPIRAHRDAGVTLVTMAKARSPTGTDAKRRA